MLLKEKICDIFHIIPSENLYSKDATIESECRSRSMRELNYKHSVLDNQSIKKSTNTVTSDENRQEEMET